MSAAITEANTLTRQLWHIAGSGDLEELDHLVSQGVDVNAGDRTGVTALMRAAYHGQLAMVRALIGYGADPNAKDRSGLTALIMAEHGGHEEIVEALRRVGAQGETDVTRQSRPVASVTGENIDAATEHDCEFSETPQIARTLHEPLEIWEMVHTTQPESYSPFANSRSVLSARMLVLAVGALLICSGAVFGVLALRGALSATDDTSRQPEATAQRRSTSDPPSKAPGSPASNELTKLHPGGKLRGERADPPVNSPVTSAKKSSAIQRPKATKVSASVPKQSKNVRRPTKLESESDPSVKSAKKEPAVARDPVKPSTTQKPKVIPWP